MKATSPRASLDRCSKTGKLTTLWVTAFVAGSVTIFLPLTLPAQGRNNDAVFAGPADRGLVSTCQIFGQVFSTDLLARKMLVKTPSGSIGELLFDQTTVFTEVPFDAGSNADPVLLAAEAVNGGDWLCARTGANLGQGNEKRAATVLVARRQEIQSQQREALARWLRGGAFGAVIEVKPENKTLVLEGKGGRNPKRVSVNMTDKTRFHRYIRNVEDVSKIASASGAQIRVGERMYVHGNPSADGTSLNATTVIFGDLQPIAGTIGAINTLDETVRLNELIKGESVIVHINPARSRLINPGLDSSHSGDGTRAGGLHAIDFGDIREGDSVIVLGRQDDPSGTRIDGLTMIVDFGEPTLQGISQRITWKLMPLRLGLP